MLFTEKLLEQLPYWIFLYQEGYSYKKIGRVCSIGSTTVYRYLKHLDIIDPANTNTFRKGELNPRWAGDTPRIRALHTWVRRHKQMPSLCEICKIHSPIDLANISLFYNSTTYNRTLTNWKYLCRRCHMISDGRMKYLKHHAR